MFRLNDAVRRYRAQHQSPTELRCVAATATTLSPSANPDAAGVVASVAAVAAPTPESTDLARLIEQLKKRRGSAATPRKRPSYPSSKLGAAGQHQRPLESPAAAPTNQRSR